MSRSNTCMICQASHTRCKRLPYTGKIKSRTILQFIGDCFTQARSELLIPGGTVLSPIEKILFAIAVLISLYFTYRGVMRIVGHIASGQGKPDWSLIWKRIGDLIAKVVFFQPVFRL